MTRPVVALCGLWLVYLATLLPLSAQQAVTLPTNKHNLSTSGPGPVQAQTTTEICIFCHTPHNANTVTPLWSQNLSSATYTTYTSSTMNATVGVPQGSSKLCLSCHDGTVAIGNIAGSGQIPMNGLPTGKLTGSSSLGTNLRDDHPISFVPSTGATLVNPPAGSPVALDANGQVQCVSCHDAHQQDIDTTTKKFLVMNNSGSSMCLVCHRPAYWSTNPSTHMTSTKPYAAAQGAHTGYATVASNGCESCHKPHTAAAAARTLKGVEEATCTPCHGPNAIGRNIQAEFSKAYTHPTMRVSGVHDPTEGPGNAQHTLPEVSAAAPRHAECEDCHNPHASYAATATAPKASGKLAGVWGINRTSSLVQPSGSPPSVNEYEICFKCHGDSANMPQANGQPAPPYPNRVAQTFNKRVQFDTTAVSYHPIEAAAKATASPSLKAPWTLTSIMSCTDCHDNDTGPNGSTPGTGPSGPHGSSFKHLLAGRYDMDNSNTTESAAAYALCYKCHDRTIVLGPTSFKEHNRHVLNENASCSICHDPHGVSAAQGTTLNNAHLVNFDKRFVTPSSSGLLKWEQTSPGRGRCYLTCHGDNHNPESY
ncbi:MAG: cytochrome c3 family protein [Vicinamibacterales bacterium]